jgi:hypothetical protein
MISFIMGVLVGGVSTLLILIYLGINSVNDHFDHDEIYYNG